MGNIILSGDRPTGKLHLGHYAGSLKERIRLQNEGDYDKFYIMIADVQALTDNFSDPNKIKDSVLELVADYLSLGIDPSKVTIFIQSKISALPELTIYYMNLVTVNRAMRNPTIKSEIDMRSFSNSIPMGFLNYPISQAADITGFKANLVPVGNDQEPMLEQTREIVSSFNHIYGNVLVSPKGIYPTNKDAGRLKGIDGKNKMSKSLNNAIYLSDEEDVLREKVMKMYTDPLHIKVSDPGHVENNTVFEYLDVFSKDEDFTKYLPDYNNLDELKKAYQKGGVGDVLIKKFLFNVLNEFLTPVREKRKKLINNKTYLKEILKEGERKANEAAGNTLKEVKKAMKLNYFEDNNESSR